MSSYSGDAAEQVVRMTLEGAEVAIRLAGSGAKHLAILLYAVLRDQKRTRGKVRLTNMIRSGKELKVFAVEDRDLQKFCTEAKRYGVLYTVLKDRDANDGRTDIMVRAEDASKINRIFDRFQLTKVEMGSVRAEITRGREKTQETGQETKVLTRQEKEDEFVDAILSKEAPSPNFSEDRTNQSLPSGSSLKKQRTEERDYSDASPAGKRPSVRKELEEIRKEQQARAAKTPEKSLEHKAPVRTKKRKKEKSR